jgi:ATP-dependent DNA helicase DinG
VDVPGHSLRLVVMEQVPWPKPSILHARPAAAGGGSGHDDRLIRARLAQAFGRLIRRQGDKGVFVLLLGLPARRAAGDALWRACCTQAFQ